MQSNKKILISKTAYIVLDVLLLIVYTCSVYFLLYQQTKYKVTGLYQSDLVDHIDTALAGGGYSLLASVFRWIYKCIPSVQGIVVFLVLVSVITVFCIAIAIDKWVNTEKENKSMIYKYIPIAIAGVVLSSVYIPVIYPYFYKGTCLTQPWHNSTYLLMRCVGVLVMLVYFEIEKHYLEYISLKEMIVFTVLLVLVNYAKPNFIIAFAPMMLIYLIVDFIRTRGRSCIPNVKFGVCVLASLPILVVQSTILYPKGGESKIVFTLNNIINGLRSGELVLFVLSSLLFPIVVTLLLKQKGSIAKRLQQSWIMWIISWTEKLFLTETGYRMDHGNFGWGSRFFSFFLVMVCVAEWLHAYKIRKIERKEFLAGCIFLLPNIVCGMYYFSYLLTGQLYYI